jgi:hypothetical protein
VKARPNIERPVLAYFVEKLVAEAVIVIAISSI